MGEKKGTMFGEKIPNHCCDCITLCKLIYTHYICFMGEKKGKTCKMFDEKNLKWLSLFEMLFGVEIFKKI